MSDEANAALWIPIEKRLPEEGDADCDGYVWIWHPFYIPDPEGRPDDDEPKFVLGGYRASRDRWNWIRSNKPTHWMRTGLVRPLPPTPQSAKQKE